MPRTVWALTTGAYSDYGVVALFEQEEDALAIRDARRRGELAMYEEWAARDGEGWRFWNSKVEKLRVAPDTSDIQVESFELYAHGEEFGETE